MYSEEIIDTSDIDWFACDADGRIATFATAAQAFLPLAAHESIADHEMLFDYFVSLPEVSKVSLCEAHLPVFKTTMQRTRYLESFYDMAKRGLISYDSEYIDRRPGGDCNYKLIAYPETPLLLSDLPDDIYDRMVRIKIKNACLFSCLRFVTKDMFS